MDFYTVRGTCNGEIEEAKELDNRGHRSGSIARKVYAINLKAEGKYQVVPVEFQDRSLEINIAISEENKKINPENIFKKYCKEFKIDAEIDAVEPIGVIRWARDISEARHMRFVEDAFDINAKLGISNLCRLNVNFEEKIFTPEEDADELSREGVFRDAEYYHFGKEYKEELERIFDTHVAKAGRFFIPVHYIFEVDDRVMRRGMADVLANALYTGKRITNKRFTIMEVDPYDEVDFRSIQEMYESSQKGAVLINFIGNDVALTNFAKEEERAARIIARTIKKYRHDVVTMLSLPRGAQTLKNLFYEVLEDISFVELKEDKISKEEAIGDFREMARNEHLRIDRALLDELEDNKQYYYSEIVKIFHKWSNDKIRRAYYPAYSKIEKAEKKISKDAQGDSFKELMELVGLDSAKKVITQAVNSFKARKLFKEKGLDQEEGAMHMVFTGNPGSAKTTVARLFAGILRDNGVLEGGQLIEVGRADLVGKYVGWTAKTVRQAFSRARGGVLFIDEAYSLVDDSNSFGDEAINTIVQEMENHRNDTVVIFAGYPKEMDTFLCKNPGLRSRIAFHVPFSGYNGEELTQIAKLMAGKKHLDFTEDALLRLKEIFTKASNIPEFGNGRYVRNVLERAQMNQGCRLLEQEFDKITDEDIHMILREDIEEIIPADKQESRQIGFIA